MNRSAILWELENLNNTGSALYFAAHPDDENTRLISYLANERHIRTAYLALTRGDGGQNLIGSEKGPLLGMIRTQELLAARRTDHATQFFSRAYDFGFSKNPEETFRFWNKDSVLADAVWVIRTFKPDVIICRFPTTGEGGHGHHTASAIIAEEAFVAAADPAKFPEQLKYTSTWQAKRLVWNTFNFGGKNTTSSDQLKLDVGGFNPLLGKYNGEIAAESRSMHKSQGFGSEKSRGSQLEYFKHIKGTEAKNDLFDGIDTTWNRFVSDKNLVKEINDLPKLYTLETPSKFTTRLLHIYKELSKPLYSNSKWTAQIEQKKATLQKIILAYNNIWMDATTGTAIATRREKIDINYSLLNSGSQKVTAIKIAVLNKDSAMQLSLANNELKTVNEKVIVPAKAASSTPYWLKTFPKKGMFQGHDVLTNTKAENDPALTTYITLQINKDTLTVPLIVHYKKTDPVKGEQYQPLQIMPDIVMDLPYNNSLFVDHLSKTIPVTVISFDDSINGTLKVKAPSGWDISIKNPHFHLKEKGAKITIPVTVTAMENSEDGDLIFNAETDDKIFSKKLTTIEYDHIPKLSLLQPAALHVVYEAIKVPDVKIAYIPGAGDDVAEILKELGMDVTVLNDEQLRSSSLSAYDVVITGVRAYNTNETLQALHEKMMNYVKQGGSLIVQYNTNSRVGPLKTEIGPYPFKLTSNRVTDETAPITILDNQSQVFNMPNKITQKDFDGWIQERGIYFASDWDAHYQTLLRMNDPGEQPNDGSLILTPYGKGNFVYTGLVFFRELPAGVPGAYKLFLNLLALSKR